MVQRNRKLKKQKYKRSCKSRLFLKMKRLSRWQWSRLKRWLLNRPLLMEEPLDSKQKTEIVSVPSSITITIQLQNSTYLSVFLLRELNNNSLHLNSANLNKNKPRLWLSKLRKKQSKWSQRRLWRCTISSLRQSKLSSRRQPKWRFKSPSSTK
jgi:hypothetical protein